MPYIYILSLHVGCEGPWQLSGGVEVSCQAISYHNIFVWQKSIIVIDIHLS